MNAQQVDNSETKKQHVRWAKARLGPDTGVMSTRFDMVRDQGCGWRRVIVSGLPRKYQRVRVSLMARELIRPQNALSMLNRVFHSWVFRLFFRPTFLPTFEKVETEIERKVGPNGKKR
jgi:hypothetical protein